MLNTYYAKANDNRLQLLEHRPFGMGLFQDIDAKVATTVICSLASVKELPNPTNIVEKGEVVVINF